jgi:hypothetical protein
MEMDMTKRFLCVLYYKSRNSLQIEKSGMSVKEIWSIMGYHSFGGEIEQQVIEKLAYNNNKNGHIKFVNSQSKVKLTESGKKYGKTRYLDI